MAEEQSTYPCSSDEDARLVCLCCFLHCKARTEKQLPCGKELRAYSLKCQYERQSRKKRRHKARDA